ncbi:hypothetical protein BH09BAC1_BH09BAC1_17630 [soil metagenome]
MGVAKKNQQLLANPVEEALGLVKHSNGSDWWLFTHEERYDHPDSCSNKYLRFLIQNNGYIFGPYEQHVGIAHCDPVSFGGELSISTSGKYLSKTVAGEGKTFIYSIDRCSGTLTFLNEVNGTVINYGTCIFEDYLYVSENDFGVGSIYQYKLLEPIINATKKTIYRNNTMGVMIGQLEANNGQVFVSFSYAGFDAFLKSKFQRHLSVIEFPETDSARIRNEYIYLGDSAKTSYGLPNFPNYNLGPEGVFLATAGKDTMLCSNTNNTGVTIGTSPVPNITYLWQPNTGLSATNIAQPIATPTQSTWYYLTATDTTVTSCAVNTDSVYVEVRICTGIGEGPGFQARVYPNPTNGLLTVDLPVSASGHTFTVFNLLGQSVFSSPLMDNKTVLDLNLKSGVYIYQIISSQGEVLTRKVVVE